MEKWAIGYKSVLLLYVIAAIYFSAAGGTDAAAAGDSLQSLELLAFLLYICVNITIYIVNNARFMQLVILLSLLLAAFCAYGLHPLYILLLPPNLYELAAFYAKRFGFSLIIALIPALFINPALLPQYGFVACSAFLVLAMARLFQKRMELYEQTLETRRSEIERLSRALNENEAFIRQSEYTYRLEERNKLSQQIHDQIGHAMAGALIQMEAAKRLLSSDADKASALLQNAIAISKEGIESIRLTLKSIKPPTEELGINRLRLMIDEFTGTHGLDATLTHNGNIDAITPLQWKIIQENVLEAMTNAVKYADATRIEVDVTVLKAMIKATVCDNGKGAGKVVKGLGIIGMEERTAAANGTVIIDGAHGFRVTTLIPIQ
ncbi:MAG TPA: histidine kinase [Bacilli bacterium]